MVRCLGHRGPDPYSTRHAQNPTADRARVSILLPEGRLKKRLRAAWRWRQKAGLLSLLWPFFQRFNLAETPEGNFPERPMPTKLKGPASRDAETRAEPTWVHSPLHFLFLWRHFRIRVRYRGKTVNIRFYLSSRLKIPSS